MRTNTSESMDKLLGRKEKDEAPHATHTLVLAAQAKPFPFAVLAAAQLINSHSEEKKKKPIHITMEPVGSFDSAEQTSTVKLLRKEVYLPLHKLLFCVELTVCMVAVHNS